MTNNIEGRKIKYHDQHNEKQNQSSDDLEKSKLLSELYNLRIENEILKERLIQIKEITSL